MQEYYRKLITVKFNFTHIYLSDLNIIVNENSQIFAKNNFIITL